MENALLLIIDGTGKILWSSDLDDAKVHGLGIMHDVEQGKRSAYEPEIGAEWTGELKLVEEIARTSVPPVKRQN